MKVSFHTFGCKVNFVDSIDIAKKIRNNFEIEESALDADIHIVNTCAVTSAASQKANLLINRILKKSNTSKIFVIGCAVRGDLIKKNNNRVLIIDNKKEDIVNTILLLKKDKINLENKIKNINKDLNPFRTRVFVKIQEGCNSFCSYCIVPYLRGREESRDIIDIVSEIKTLEYNGVEEVVLTGTAIGKYAYGLTSLIKAILFATRDIRIRLSSLRPSEINPELINIMKYGRLTPHLHISYQNGSDRILGLMNRFDYKGEDLLRVRDLLDKKIAHLKPFLAADVIVGFPTETTSDFIKTYNLLERANMTYLHIFPYSPRPKTPAAKMQQVNHKEVKYRKNMLHNLSNNNFTRALYSMKGNIIDLVWETKYARSSNYFKVEKLDNSIKRANRMFVVGIKNNILQVI